MFILFNLTIWLCRDVIKVRGHITHRHACLSSINFCKSQDYKELFRAKIAMGKQSNNLHYQYHLFKRT